MMAFIFMLLVGMFVFVDLLSLIGIVSWLPSASRAIYHKVRGHIVVETPDDLRVAVANGLIRAGSEMIVGHSHEGNGETITRFALHPSVAGRPVGTKLKVVSVSRKRLVLEESRRPLAV